MTVTYDLMHLAFQGDISRVFTFLLGHEASSRSYAHIGIPDAHHSISHHGNDAEKLAKYAKIGIYQIVKLGEFLDKLKATPDGDGNLLDHSMLYWGSGMSNGNQHDRNNPPALIVGGAQRPAEGQPPRRRRRRTSRPRTCCWRWASIAGVEIEKLGRQHRQAGSLVRSQRVTHRPGGRQLPPGFFFSGQRTPRAVVFDPPAADAAAGKAVSLRPTAARACKEVLRGYMCQAAQNGQPT